MEKDDITREHFRSPLLKNVVIRIDYSEITNFEGLIQTMIPFLKSYFEKKGKYTTNNINVTISEKELANERIPISVLPPNEVYRFTSCNIIPVQTVALDVANTFACLIIDSDEHYDKIDNYIELISEVMSKIMAYDAYTTIKRIAIRKIDSKLFDSLDAAKQIFANVEHPGTNHPSMDTYQYRVTSFMLNQATGTQINLSRTYNITDDGKYQVDLDIDGYIGIDRFLQQINNQESVSQTLFSINELLFEFFKQNVTESFLNNGLKE